MQVQSYINFNGRADEAIEFYRAALGAEVVMLLRFKDSPVPTPSGNPDKIMHAELRIGDTKVMLSDGDCTAGQGFQGISLALTLDKPEQADRCFEALAKGGQVRMPLAQTFFSPRFGMLTDRFGIGWMVQTAAPAA